jgi:hypothetical protein
VSNSEQQEKLKGAGIYSSEFSAIPDLKYSHNGPEITKQFLLIPQSYHIK